jgi:hypothetical protein
MENEEEMFPEENQTISEGNQHLEESLKNTNEKLLYSGSLDARNQDDDINYDEKDEKLLYSGSLDARNQTHDLSNVQFTQQTQRSLDACEDIPSVISSVDVKYTRKKKGEILWRSLITIVLIII